jgi:hypothetical protein
MAQRRGILASDSLRRRVCEGASGLEALWVGRGTWLVRVCQMVVRKGWKGVLMEVEVK